MKIDKDICKKYNIKNSELIDLQDFNVIIGKNGAGKTRLLKAIRDYFNKNDSITTIYAYMPSMNSNFVDRTQEEYDESLYEIIFEREDICLDDFIGETEQQAIEVLNLILEDIRFGKRFKHSAKGSRGRKVQQDFSNITSILLNCQIIFEENEEVIYLESINDNVRTPLLKALERMSPGELSLFYLSILIIFFKNHKRGNNKLALLIDEPELHLHPDAMLKFFDYIKNNSLVDICCIATHSIYLIPTTEFYNIIFINDSEVQKPTSKLYDDIFNILIGNGEAISDFLISRDSWQYYEFIAECFCLPNVVNKVNVKDEQFLKFVNAMHTLHMKEMPIKVLDYGAGSGRLGRTIEVVKRTNGFDDDEIQYFYFDKYEDKPGDLQCKAFKNISEIKQSGTKFDCVVLMNVLHEVDVNEWKKLFNDIYNILRNDGFLLVFEVETLLHGEQPYGDSGYILLKEEQMNILFSSSKIKNIKLSNDDKTNLYIIPKAILDYISLDNIEKALTSLKESIYNNLETEYSYRRKIAHRKEKAPRQNVRKYGFMTQQYLNCIFALDRLQSLKIDEPEKERDYSKYTIDEIMNKINENCSVAEYNKLRTELLRRDLLSDMTIIREYSNNGTAPQKKAAKYYMLYRQSILNESMV